MLITHQCLTANYTHMCVLRGMRQHTCMVSYKKLGRVETLPSKKGELTITKQGNRRSYQKLLRRQNAILGRFDVIIYDMYDVTKSMMAIHVPMSKALMVIIIQ